MFVDAQGKEFESIQGRKATVVYDTNGFFEDDERVVILENSSVPYCVSVENYIEGNNSFEEYQRYEFNPLVLEVDLIIEGDEE